MTINRNLLVITLIATSAIFISGCEQQDNAKVETSSAPKPDKAETTSNTANPKASKDVVMNEWQEFTQSLKAYSQAEQEQAITAVNTEMQRIDARIDSMKQTLDSQAASVSAQTNEARKATIKAVEEQREALESWANKLQDSSEDAWAEVTDGFSEAYGVLEQSLEDAEQQFTEDSKNTSDA
ncbi:hypothetical protein [Oceanicoccus sp. KOV_DT_Chl]|uniref:hypothetical protein n=1 Tax=Oceanicoccus sp. KOV_DT_Chl TaxID=1904639 RepID=UPI000C7ACFD6|nr:hypothetical protein [Oceanicoccus sp. KOV_DT_Chl]